MRSSIFWLLLGLLICVAGNVTAQPDTAHAVPHDSATGASAPVVFNDDTLFMVRARIGAFSARERADAVSTRLRNLVNDPLFHLDSLTVADQETMSDILERDVAIMTVTDEDAALAGIPRGALARSYARSMFSALQQKQHDVSLRVILLGVLFTLLATAVLVLVIRLLNVYFPRFYKLLNAWHGTRIKSLKIQQLELLPADRIVLMLIGLAKLVRMALVLLLLYVYLPLVLSFFPWTKGLAAKLLGYVTHPVGLIVERMLSYLPNLFIIIVVLVVAHYSIRLIRLLFNEVKREAVSIPGFYAEWADPTYKIVRFLCLAFVAIIIFPYLPGSNSPAFQGVGLFLTLLISLGSASAISNIVSGVVLTYTRAFSLGDRVKIADTVGDIVEKTLLVTRVRTIKNVDITIPNSMVLGAHITNFSSSAKQHGLILHTSVTIGYDVPWRQIHELLITAAGKCEHILKEPPPFVLQTSLDDWYVAYELNAYTDQPNRMAVIYSDLHARIQDTFAEAGVEIMSPHYQAVRDGNATALPDEYLPGNYSAPGFRVAPLITNTPESSGKTPPKS
ncbi:MAG: mechanosensitive ion channel domain-containing protein [Bacteroidota bacterium]